MKKIYSLILILILISSCSNFDQKKMRADAICEKIDKILEQIQKDVIKTAEDSKVLFENPEKYESGLYMDAKYEFHDGVMYHNPINQGYGRFLYTGYFPVGDAEKTKVKILEYAIPPLKWLTDESEFSDYIIQSYLITYDTLIVFYPYSDLISFIPPKWNIQDRNAWKNLSLKNNPERTYNWTSPYVDTTGKGFMVDVIYPVYKHNFMEAYVGIDITISTLKKKLFDGIDEKMLLIDKDTAQIMVISDYAVELLGIENVSAFKYLEMIDNSKPDRKKMPDNLILTKTNSAHMQELWNRIGETEEFSISIDGKKHQVYRKIINNPQWYFVIIE